MSNIQPLEYTGDKEYQPQPDSQNTDLIKRRQCPYIPSPELVKAVNLAIYLQRPLLLKGEPGCGKTLLARAIAYEFGKRLQLENYNYPYFSWNIKSTTRAKEGLYTYDAVGRLRDAQLVSTDSYKTYLKQEEIQELSVRLKNPDDYITWGALGNAFREEKRRPILLIDEIDKADIDFPNDLLLELEEQRFQITETGEEIKAKQPPIVIITSNDEKELPDAFLRRCIFFYIEFPSKERLQEILEAHFPDFSNEELVKAAVEKFINLRKIGSGGKYGKKASTSELIDLISWLKSCTSKEAWDIIENLASDENQHLLGALLKTKEDQERYKKEEGID